MAKKDKKIKEDMPQGTEEGESSNKKLDDVLSGINILAGAVNKLVELQTAVDKEEKVEKKQVGHSYTPHLDDDTYPKDYLPPKFRKIVDEHLSADFGARVVDFEDRTEFQFDIIVPEKYSSVTKEDREKGVQDIRTRIIPRALGENGVREWCQLIRKNLNKYYTNEGKASPFINSAE